MNKLKYIIVFFVILTPLFAQKTKDAPTLDLRKLNNIEKELVKLKFTTKLLKDRYEGKLYKFKNWTVVDIYNTRIVYQDSLEGVNEPQDLDIPFKKPDESDDVFTKTHLSPDSKKLKVTYTNLYRGTFSMWSFIKFKFEIDKNILTIFDKKIDLKSKDKKVIFIDSKGKFKGIFKIK